MILGRRVRRRGWGGWICVLDLTFLGELSGRKVGDLGYGEKREICGKKVVYRLVKMSRFQGLTIVSGLF